MWYLSDREFIKEIVIQAEDLIVVDYLVSGKKAGLIFDFVEK